MAAKSYVGLEKGRGSVVKCLNLLAASMTLLLGVGAEAQRGKVVFAFMGDDTVTRTSRTDLGGMPCVTEGRKLQCGPSDAIVYNGERLNFLSIDYWDGRMIRAVGAFDRAQHARVHKMLVAVYGKPQRAGYQTMAERPDLFTYSETVWEFDDGRLELDSRTDSSPVLLFRFSVEYPPDDDHGVNAPAG